MSNEKLSESVANGEKRKAFASPPQDRGITDSNDVQTKAERREHRKESVTKKIRRGALVGVMLLMFGCASVPVPARAQMLVYGTNKNLALGNLDTTILFSPTNEVLITGLNISAGPPIYTRSTNGYFWQYLDGGDYSVSFPEIPWRTPFFISVSNCTSCTNNIIVLMSPPRTYTYTASFDPFEVAAGTNITIVTNGMLRTISSSGGSGSGSGDMLLADQQTVTGNKIFQDDALKIQATGNSGKLTLNATASAVNRTITFPSTTGTVAIQESLTSVYQPLDADLTSVAALGTVSFGRSFLTVADAAAGRTLIGAGTSSFDGVFASLTSKPTTVGGYGITDFNSLGDARWQPLDSDLTSIAALTTATYGRSLLELASASAGRTSLGLVIGTDVQAYDADLDDLADGSLSGSKIGSGIIGDNISSGTVADARIASTITRDTEWDTIAEIETATGVNIILNTEIDTSSELAAILTDETGAASGTPLAVFNQSPTIVTPTIASFANANHTHQNSAGGGTLDGASIASGTVPNARLDASVNSNAVPARGWLFFQTNAVNGTWFGINTNGSRFSSNAVSFRWSIHDTNSVLVMGTNNAAGNALTTNIIINPNGSITPSGGGGAAWGGITGTLSSQTDLQAALDAKASDASVTTLAAKTITRTLFPEGDYNLAATTTWFDLPLLVLDYTEEADGDVWEVIWNLAIEPSAAGGIQVAVVYGSTPDFDESEVSIQYFSASTISSTYWHNAILDTPDVTFESAGSGSKRCVVRAVIKTTTAAGNLTGIKLKATQIIASGTTTIRAGSTMVARKLN